MRIDIGNLIKQILESLRNEMIDGWQTISGFSEDQARKIATQAAMITSERTAGALRDDDDLFEFFVEQLKRLTENFVRTVAAMTILTLEKSWNAVVGVVWRAINAPLEAAGLGTLMIPGPPSV